MLKNFLSVLFIMICSCACVQATENQVPVVPTEKKVVPIEKKLVEDEEQPLACSKCPKKRVVSVVACNSSETVKKLENKKEKDSATAELVSLFTDVNKDKESQLACGKCK